jgi:hypothetical protein
MLTAALQFKLSGSRHFETASNQYRRDLVEPLRSAWYRHWPDGLAIPDPRLPDRDPLITGAMVSPEFDPLGLRPPMALWSIDEPGVTEAVIRGLSQFISNGDIRRLDQHLFSTALESAVMRTSRTSSCALSRRRYEGQAPRIVFDCEADGIDSVFVSGHLYIDEDGGVVGETGGFRLGEKTNFEELSLSGRAIFVKQGRSSISLDPVVKRTGLHPRLPDGSAVETIVLSFETLIEEDFGPSDEIPEYRDNGRLVVTLVPDFEPVHAAIADLGRASLAGELDLFFDQPFRRRAVIGSLLRRLGLTDVDLCCAIDEKLPAGVVASPLLHLTDEAGEPDPAAAVRQAFAAYCAVCHATGEAFPPNFLRGKSGPIGNAIAQCGQRIAYRLAMWNRPEAQRNKSPMPPQSFLLHAGISEQQWRDSRSFAELSKHMSGLLALTGSSLVRAEFIGDQDYEALPSCLATGD